MNKKIFIIVVMLLAGALAIVLFGRHSGTAMPVYKGKTVRAWLREVSTTNANTAYEAFSQMDTNALPFLVNMFRESDSPADKLYQRIYPKLPGMFQQHLLRPMREDERWSAASRAIMMNRHWPLAHPKLFEILKDKNNRAHGQILETLLGGIGPKDTNGVPTIIECLSEPDWRTRALAAGALGRIGNNAKSAIPNLTVCLKDTNAGVRFNAAIALWEVGAITNGMAELKQAAMTYGRSSEATFKEAIRLLSNMGCTDPELIPSFEKAVNSSDQSVSMCSIQALARYGSVANEAVPVLAQKFEQSSDETVKQTILRALSEIDPETAAKYSGK